MPVNFLLLEEIMLVADVVVAVSYNVVYSQTSNDQLWLQLEHSA